MHKTYGLIVLGGLVLIGTLWIFIHPNTGQVNQINTGYALTNPVTSPKQEIPMSYTTNIINETATNTYFRRVLFTDAKTQLVVMSIAPGNDVGLETHKYTEQTLFFLSGTGECLLNNKTFPVKAGDVVIVTAGTKHNFINTGTEPLKIYTVYTPPNHIDGRIHKTKADADADFADEAIGETAPAN